MNRRVAVTGIGVIAGPGRTRNEFWGALANGESSIRPMTLVPQGALRFTNAAEVPGYRATDYFDEKQADFLDRFAQFAVIGAREALADAGLTITPGLAERMAVVTGTSTGGQTSEDTQFQELYAAKPSAHARIHPLTIARTMANAGTSAITREFGIVGPSLTISTACSSANHAIGQAFWMVRHGAAEVAVAGGSEAPFSLGFLKAWEAMRIVAPDTCRPFSADRRGLILGEGAAMLVLEPLERAEARGAHVWGEIIGFGMSSDAHHLTQPLADGAARAMQAALSDGETAPESIGYINAHGTGTAANDATETAAIHQVFGAHAAKLAVSSTKSMHGHALGAAGALEAAATLLALHEGILPPTANFTKPDPACDLDVIPNVARRAQVEWALSNSFAFGGLNAVLAFRSLR
jgi:nodulation protein E